MTLDVYVGNGACVYVRVFVCVCVCVCVCVQVLIARTLDVHKGNGSLAIQQDDELSGVFINV